MAVHRQQQEQQQQHFYYHSRPYGTIISRKLMRLSERMDGWMDRQCFESLPDAIEQFSPANLQITSLTLLADSVNFVLFLLISLLNKFTQSCDGD